METGRVKSYVSRKGKRIKSHIRRKKTKKKLKNYAANAVLATAAYKTFSQPALRIANPILNSRISNKIKTKTSELVAKGLTKVKLNSAGVPIKLSSKFLPAGLITYYGVKQGAKAIGWAVDQNKKQNKGKVRGNPKRVIPFI